MATVCTPTLPLLERPDRTAPCVDEALFGETLTVLSAAGCWRYVVTDSGYTGWTDAPLGPDTGGSLTVTARFSHVLPAPDGKCPTRLVLPRGARVAAESRRGDWLRLRGLGWIPAADTAPPPERPLGERMLAVAEDYLGVPYRWGGRSPWGIDCSGLCYMAARLCGVSLWRDAVPRRGVEPVSASDARAGDPVYFPGHMALYAGAGEILHASQRRGGVVRERLQAREDLRDKAAFYRILP